MDHILVQELVLLLSIEKGGILPKAIELEFINAIHLAEETSKQRTRTWSNQERRLLS